MASQFGKIFSITTYGESHGMGIGVVLDGCPSRLPITQEEIQVELDRRRPGQSSLTTQRKEGDRIHIYSGVFEGLTLGTPIAMGIINQDAKSKDYAELKDVFRPGHADYTTLKKYGIRDHRGGGRASARETAGRVAAGAIAKKLLSYVENIEVLGWVSQIQNIAPQIDGSVLTSEAIEASPVRCPDPEAAQMMTEAIETARESGDSLGGIVSCQVKNVPAGLGEPVFDKLDADIAKAVLSIPAAKGMEIGSGFEGAKMSGKEQNDPIMQSEGRIQTATNNSGGIQGGISNGENIFLNVAFKPTSTISLEQDTVNQEGEAVKLSAEGRHDPCVLPRAVPVVETMVALVLADHWMRQLGTAALNNAAQ